MFLHEGVNVLQRHIRSRSAAQTSKLERARVGFAQTKIHRGTTISVLSCGVGLPLGFCDSAFLLLTCSVAHSVARSFSGSRFFSSASVKILSHRAIASRIFRRIIQSEAMQILPEAITVPREELGKVVVNHRNVWNGPLRPATLRKLILSALPEIIRL